MLKEDRANSVPELAPIADEQQNDDPSLEGVTAPIKLLLKLIQDHKEACGKGKNDSRRMLRVATMMTILDTVKARIQKCQSFGNKKNQASLRRCNTDLRLNQPPKDKKTGVESPADEKEKLRRELSACIAARKRLELMCSSLGKEKEIMAMELSRKAHELCAAEELVNDLKAQNEKLVRKVQKCSSNNDSKCVEGESQSQALQQQNKFLNEMLVSSHNGYQLMKQKLNKAEKESVMVCGMMDEMRDKIESSLSRVQRFKNHVSVDVREDVEALENMLEYFQTMVAKYDNKEG